MSLGKTMEITARKKITKIIQHPMEFDELRADGWVIETIDGHSVIGFCESCNVPITENEDFTHYADGVLICKSC